MKKKNQKRRAAIGVPDLRRYGGARFFFFSSRRRHTRCGRDWSSDVCSSDLLLGELEAGWEGPFLVGTLAAAGSGLLAIEGLLGYVRRHDYTACGVYRL